MGMESHTIGEEGVINSQANTVFVAEKFSRNLKFIYLHEQVVVKFNKRQLRGAWRGIYMIPKPYWLRKYVIKNMVFPEKLVQRFDTRVSDNQGRIYNVYRAEWRFLMAQPFMTLLADGLDSLATTLATPGYPMERITSDAQKLRTALSSPSFSESLESVATGLVELYELFDNLVIRLEEADNSGEGFSTETSSDFINHFLYAQEIIQYSTEGLHDLIRLNENLPQNLLSGFNSINPGNTLEPNNSSKYIEKPTSQGNPSTLEKDILLNNFTDIEYSRLESWLSDTVLRDSYITTTDMIADSDPTFDSESINDGQYVVNSMALTITMQNKEKHPNAVMIKSYIVSKIQEGVIDTSKEPGVKIYAQKAAQLLASRAAQDQQEISTGNYSFEKGGIPLSKILEAEPKEFCEKEVTGVDGFDFAGAILGTEEMLVPFQKERWGKKGTWVKLFTFTLNDQKDSNLNLFKNTDEDMLSLLHKMIIESPKFKQEAIETGIIVDDTANNQVSTQDKVQKTIDSTAIIKGFKEPNISKKSTAKSTTQTTSTGNYSFEKGGIPLSAVLEFEYKDSNEGLSRLASAIETKVALQMYAKEMPDPKKRLQRLYKESKENLKKNLNIDVELNDTAILYILKNWDDKDDLVNFFIKEGIIIDDTANNQQSTQQEVAKAFTPPVVNNVETQDSKNFSEISDIVDSKEFDRVYDVIVSTMDYANNTLPTEAIKGIAIGLTNTYTVLNMFEEEAVKDYVITVLKNGFNMSQEPWLESYIKNAPATETVTQQATQQEITEGVPLPLNEADSMTQSVSQQVPQQMAEVIGIKDSAGEALDKNDNAPGSGAKTVAPKVSDRIGAEDETTDYEIVEDEFPIELALEIVAYYNQKVGELSKTIDKPMVVKMKATKSTVETFKNTVPKGVMFDGTTIKQLLDAVKDSDRESLHQEITTEFATQEYDEMADIDSSEDVPVDAETWKKGQPIVVEVINWEEFQKIEEVFNNGVGSSPPASDHTIVLSPEVTIDKALAKLMLEKYERVHKSLLRELDGEFGYVKTAHSKAIKLVMDNFKGDKAISQIAKNAGGFASLVHLIQKYFDNQTDHR